MIQLRKVPAKFIFACGEREVSKVLDGGGGGCPSRVAVLADSSIIHTVLHGGKFALTYPYTAPRGASPQQNPHVSTSPSVIKSNLIIFVDDFNNKFHSPIFNDPFC